MEILEQILHYTVILNNGLMLILNTMDSEMLQLNYTSQKRRVQNLNE